MTHENKTQKSNHFVDTVSDALLRGGRMAKFKGQAASIAPQFSGSVPGLVLADMGRLGGALAGSLGSAINSAPSRLARSASAGAMTAAFLAAPAALTVTGAQAGTCDENGAGSGIWTCSGVIAAADVQKAQQRR